MCESETIGPILSITVIGIEPKVMLLDWAIGDVNQLRYCLRVNGAYVVPKAIILVQTYVFYGGRDMGKSWRV